MAAKDTLKIVAQNSKFVVNGGEDDSIYINLEHFNDPDIWEYSIEEGENSLHIKESFTVWGSTPTPTSYALWEITVPGGTEVIFTSSDATLWIMDCEGQFGASTASGNIRIENSSGTFDVSTASGEIRAYDITLRDSSSFSSAYDDVYLSLSGGQDYALRLQTTIGNAVLDFNGKPVQGYFEFSARADKGRIVSAYTYDQEAIYQDVAWVYRNDNDFGKMFDYHRKSFVRAGSVSNHYIGTITGTAILIRSLIKM
ncbi:MAG: DUF4097 family beta strand repeat-containing protein [Candidatus Neomarinimicrobiota bacterium]